jgi:aminoglycoside 6-adenylyltransferase
LEKRERETMRMVAINAFLEKVAAWAEIHTDIQAVLLIGSLARETHPADEWSDVDLILFADDIEIYASQHDWLADFGDVLVPVIERHQSGDVEWLVLFADGVKVDFYFTPGAGDLTAVIAQASYNLVICRGAKLLYSRPGTEIQLPPFKFDPFEPPDVTEFQTVVHEMLLNGYKMAKLIKRGDLVRAKLVLASQMRPTLLTMIAWHAQAVFGSERDTWYNGRYLDEWADPRVLAALPNTYGGFSDEETWRSLFGLLILFRWLAEEMAVSWDYAFPAAAADQVMAWIREMYLANKT